jgi:hypothetical protein
VTAPLVVLVLMAPALLLAAAVVGLCALGPVGWVASALLVAGVVVVARVTCRRCWSWWASTKAPVRPPGQPWTGGSRRIDLPPRGPDRGPEQRTGPPRG